MIWKRRGWLCAATVLGLASAPTSMAQSIGDDWNNETIKSKYNVEPWNGFWCFVNALGAQCGVGDLMVDVLDDLPNDVAARLAAECRQENPCDYFKQISCASQKVNAYYGANGGQASHFGSSPCRSHARAVEEVVSALGIPGTEVGLTGFWGTLINSDGTTRNVGHIVNRVTIQWNGNVYVYVLDSGWFPGVFFPLTDWTQQYHKDHGRTAPRLIPFRPDCMDQTLIKGKVSSSEGHAMGGIQMSASCSGGTWFSYFASPTSSSPENEGEYQVMLLHYPLAPDVTTLVTINTASMPSDGPKTTSVGGGSAPGPVDFTVQLPRHSGYPGDPGGSSPGSGGTGSAGYGFGGHGP
jgi:hypothetical protein